MKEEMIMEKGSVFQEPPGMFQLVEKLRRRYPGKMLAGFTGRRGPFYVRGDIEYLNWLEQQWEGGSELQGKLIDPTLEIYGPKSFRPCIYGKKYTSFVVGDGSYIDELTMKWRGPMAILADLK